MENPDDRPGAWRKPLPVRLEELAPDEPDPRPVPLPRPPGAATNYYPTWARRIPAIVSILNAQDAKDLDREACELLFDIGRSATVEMMRRMGGRVLGNSLVIDSRTLARNLRAYYDCAREGLEPIHAGRRRVAAVIGEAIAEHKAKSVAIQPVHVGVRFDELPGVVFGAGRIVVEHAGAQDALARLYELAVAIAREPDRFVTALAGDACERLTV
jgi:hypothetical protein